MTTNPIPAFVRAVAYVLQCHGCHVDARPGPDLLWRAPGASTVNYLAVKPYALDCPALRVHVNTFQADASKAALTRLGLPVDARQASTPRLELTAMPDELQALAPWLAETALGISAAPCPVPLEPVDWPTYHWTHVAHEAYRAGSKQKAS